MRAQRFSGRQLPQRPSKSLAPNGPAKARPNGPAKPRPKQPIKSLAPNGPAKPRPQRPSKASSQRPSKASPQRPSKASPPTARRDRGSVGVSKCSVIVLRKQMCAAGESYLKTACMSLSRYHISVSK